MSLTVARGTDFTRAFARTSTNSEQDHYVFRVINGAGNRVPDRLPPDLEPDAVLFHATEAYFVRLSLDSCNINCCIPHKTPTMISCGL
jgi:hypothetical protein